MHHFSTSKLFNFEQFYQSRNRLTTTLSQTNSVVSETKRTITSNYKPGTAQVGALLKTLKFEKDQEKI